MKQIANTVKKMSIWLQMLIVVICVYILYHVYRSFFAKNKRKEGFEQSNSFLFKTNVPDIYDDFYSEIYDHLTFNTEKNEYEIGEIINKTTPSEQSKILVIGSATGHVVASLAEKSLNILGIDISPSMVSKAKENYPQYKFEVADAMDSSNFSSNSFTHILCMYFTVYYIKNKRMFFQNSFDWLMPGGYFILHLVDKDHFDPLLSAANPLLYLSPQKYAKKRLTKSSIKFDSFKYESDFDFKDDSNTVLFKEKITDDSNGHVRKNEHVLYMEPLEEIIQMCMDAGFILHSKIDLVRVQYEYQYLTVFTKPN
jgi:SAM-dependent methyltransferase